MRFFRTYFFSRTVVLAELSPNTTFLPLRTKRSGSHPPELAPPTKTQALAAAVIALARDTTFTPPPKWSGDGPEE